MNTLRIVRSGLHQIFNNYRVNMINNRKEFFRVSLDDIENAVRAKNNEIEFTKSAEAKQYRETLALLETNENAKSIHDVIEEKFPASLI